ncbi:DUF4153 domain-containing protein [Ornithinicoccus hortensis]|uniref:Signal transduction histidine-protein kinase/phosphatase MprB n=3 Tax=Ornithinicoccus hortensis TaxID=82346 RepID=A0A542YPC7_9MICO|nr:DUF4153 domain-containing protein [Ornithinicoccus hortensis]TQL49911.1 signal transduction histidine kinase [Ornithinicoccus hortensis]
MPSTHLRRERPLDGVTSITVKIGLLVVLSIVAAVVLMQVGSRAGVPGWITLPVALAGALGVSRWLARGMTSPLREMTRAAGQMAAGDYSARVPATSADEVGRLGHAFNTMAADLAAADQERRQLVATVSHELRTPLAAQRALLENLVDGVVTPDDTALQTALAQSERLSGLVSDLLDVSRIDGGAAPLHLAPVRVAELLGAAAAEATVGGRDVRVETRVEPTDLVVDADSARLAQVVANLLDNAIRHSPAGGTVTVHAAAADDRWFLEVGDEGPGIPAEQAQRVFERFGVGEDGGGGTGLGLAISRWVCQLHGGTIAALPPPGDATGARVRAVLPRHPSARDVQPAAPIQHRTPTQHGTPEENPVTATHPTPSSTTAATDAPPLPAATTDALFGDFWPERESLRTATGQLAGSVAVGALAALVLPYRNIGLGVLLVLLLAGGLVLASSVYRRRRWTVVSAALCVGLASLVVLRAAEWLAVLAVLVAGVLVATALTDARKVLSMLAAGATWVGSGIRGLPLLGRTLTAAGRQERLWPVLRTTALSLVALVIFGGLFASGDPVLGSWVSAVLPDITIADSLVFRGFVWFLVGGVVLAACYLALNPPRVEKVALRGARPVSRPWEWAVPAGVVLAVFVAFLVAQASAMWGGHDYVLNTTGMRYADYVHQGFAQLTAATALTLVTIALVVRKAPRSDPGDRRLLRWILGALCLLTLLVVVSALSRMAVYQQAYGFTVLRVLVDAFEVWLGILVLLVMVAGVRMSGWWLPRAALASGAALLLVIGLANPEARVAQANIDRFHEVGKLDVAYLASLGADATPVIEAGLPADLAECVVAGQYASSLEDDWLGWNLGRARAAQVSGYGTDNSRGLACEPQIGE